MLLNFRHCLAKASPRLRRFIGTRYASGIWAATDVAALAFLITESGLTGSRTQSSFRSPPPSSAHPPSPSPAPALHPSLGLAPTRSEETPESCGLTLRVELRLEDLAVNPSSISFSANASRKVTAAYGLGEYEKTLQGA